MAGNGGGHRRTGRRWLWICTGIAAAAAAAAGIWHLPARMHPGNSDGAIQARATLPSQVKAPCVEDGSRCS